MMQQIIVCNNMKVKITYKNKDYIILEGETFEEISDKAEEEVINKRGWERNNCSSKKLED